MKILLAVVLLAPAGAARASEQEGASAASSLRRMAEEGADASSFDMPEQAEDAPVQTGPDAVVDEFENLRGEARRDVFTGEPIETGGMYMDEESATSSRSDPE